MGSGVISSSPLPLVYHNTIVEHLRGDGGGGGGSGVISSSPLPLVYHNNSRIPHRGGGSGEWGD